MRIRTAQGAWQAANAAILRHGPGRRTPRNDAGFTLVEVVTSVGTMLVVLTAAYLLLGTSNANLDRIKFGGETAEANRAAIALLQRDLDRSFVPANGNSPVLSASHDAVTFLADLKPSDGRRQVICWRAEEASGTLVRVVTSVEETWTQFDPLDETSQTVQTVVTGLATASDLEQAGGLQMFTYGVDAVTAYDPDSGSYAGQNEIGLVTFRLRNGAPDRNSNVTDRTAAIRVLPYVINGY